MRAANSYLMKKTIFVLFAMLISQASFADAPDYEKQEYIEALPRLAAKLNETLLPETFDCLRMGMCKVQTASGMTCRILRDYEQTYVISRRLRAYCSTEIGPGWREKPPVTIHRSSEWIQATSLRNGVGLNERRTPYSHHYYPVRCRSPHSTFKMLGLCQ